MAFLLNQVVPWGRNLEEYQRMFLLDETDKNIAGFGDGPASFNMQATQKGMNVTSYDLIYQFTKEQLTQRIGEVRTVVMEQMEQNREQYVWTQIKDLDELEKLRMNAMQMFLADYQKGKIEGRYVYHELPNRLPVGDNTYDIGLSSHFLLMYTRLGYEFHIKAMEEMLRVCKEIRVFPLCDLDGEQTELITRVVDYLKGHYDVRIERTEYEFQKGANRLLIVK